MSKFIQGCKAGIPKAIRRSDFHLLKTCLDALADSPAWLAWRLPLWAVSECWYMAGELAQGNISAKKLIYRMAAVPKAHDAALLYLAASKLPESDEEPAELRRFRFWYDFENLHDSIQDLCTTLISGKVFHKLSEYELSAIRFLWERSLDGGYMQDRQKFLTSIYLIGSRGLKDVPEFVEQKTTDFKKHFKGKLQTVNLPWWVYDPSTALGGEVAKVFVKKYGDRFHIDLERFCFLYGLMEYAATPACSISYTDVNKCRGFDTNIWLPVVLRTHLPYRGMEAKEVKKLWEGKVLPTWQKLVERMIE